MGMVGHNLTHHFGRLGEGAVTVMLHCVQNTPLHGLQTVLNVRHGAVQNHIGGIVEEPVLEHS